MMKKSASLFFYVQPWGLKSGILENTAEIWLPRKPATSLYVIDLYGINGLVATGGIEPPTLGL
jgi:hypothetical protein